MQTVSPTQTQRTGIPERGTRPSGVSEALQVFLMDFTKPAFDQPLLFSQSSDQTAAKFRVGLEVLRLRRGVSRTPNAEG